MERIRFGMVIFIAALVTASCNSAPATLQNGPTTVPSVHFPTEVIDRADLQEYVLAFCTRSLTPNPLGDIRNDVVVTHGSYTSPITITYPTPPRRTTVNLGCLGEDDDFLSGGYGLAWRQQPSREQLTMDLSYPGIPGDLLYFVDIPDDLNLQLPEQAVSKQDKYFNDPNTLAWSPTGRVASGKR